MDPRAPDCDLNRFPFIKSKMNVVKVPLRQSNRNHVTADSGEDGMSMIHCDGRIVSLGGSDRQEKQDLS